MNDLDILSAREHLIEDIESIVTDFLIAKNGHWRIEDEELIHLLCDSVCTHFPPQK